MDLLPLDRLGARQTGPSTIEFGMILPWVNPANGQQLSVKAIHAHDQFLQHIPAVSFPMTHSVDSRYGDMWSVDVDVSSTPASVAGSMWGKPGQYVYRYCLSRPNGGDIDWIIDPYAREFGVGKQSAITVDYSPYTWSAAEATWKTPLLEDLVMYELNLAEFAQNVDGAIDRLDYLSDLGINCIQLMPVTNVTNEVDWGYLPVGYFGIDERFGNRADLQRFIDQAHQRGLAVIVDSVYGHVSRALFGYSTVYDQLRYDENPFLGPFAEDLFSAQGASTDYNRALTRDFFYSVNNHWLDVYHVDGFRYDCVPNFWDGPMGNGYANIAFETYQLVSSTTSGYWSRFSNGSRCNLIQCAEYLDGPAEILYDTYSTCAWQNATISAAESTAHGSADGLYELGSSLSLFGYPSEVTVNGTTLPKAGLQYIENHDHSRFIANFGAHETDEAGDNLFWEGDESLWYKVQPYLMGILTARGIPLLWQRQEIGENYTVVGNGLGRVSMLRPIRWDKFYEPAGQSLIGLVRKLTHLRSVRDELRRGEHYFYNNYDLYQSRGLLVFHRRSGSQVTVVSLNFGNDTQYAPFEFPIGGKYVEALQGYEWDVPAGQVTLEVPSNYGRIWTTA